MGERRVSPAGTECSYIDCNVHRMQIGVGTRDEASGFRLGPAHCALEKELILVLAFGFVA